jgi:hypothetical protein
MPTTRHRIQVQVDPLTYRTISRLAKAGRMSMSRICADVIEQAIPVIGRSAKMLEDAARLSEEAKDQLRLDLAREEATARQAYGQAFNALAASEAAIRKAAGRATGGGEARARGRPGAAKPRRRSPG